MTFSRGGNGSISTLRRRFLRPPIWPSSDAFFGFAWKKHRPPPVAAAWQGLPFFVVARHLFFVRICPDRSFLWSFYLMRTPMDRITGGRFSPCDVLTAILKQKVNILIIFVLCWPIRET